MTLLEPLEQLAEVCGQRVHVAEVHVRDLEAGAARAEHGLRIAP
jgi:hypothetical protein